MPIGLASLAYKAAEEGNAPPPPVKLVDKIAHIEDWQDLVDRAVELIIESRHTSANVRGFNAPNAWGSLLNHEGISEVEHHALMRIAIWIARGMMTYWVPDPEKEGYCAQCRKVMPLSEFGDDRWNCTQCVDRGKSDERLKG